MATQSNPHSAVEKALKILLSFIPDNQAMGTVELSENLNFHKSTVSRLLHVLTQFDLLQQNLQTKKFNLGNATDELGKALQRSYDSNLVSCAQPYIDQLSERLQETAVLEALSGKTTVLLYAAEGPGPVFVREAEGERRPVHASAGGKLLLAFTPSGIRNRYLNGQLKPITPNTMTDRSILNKQFMKIRRQGHAVDNEEVYLGIRAVGAPVFDKKNMVMAAVV
ncbi:IclR family transcriptional regulator, partial [Thermodesulfobacteriota bacterium]